MTKIVTDFAVAQGILKDERRCPLHPGLRAKLAEGLGTNNVFSVEGEDWRDARDVINMALKRNFKPIIADEVLKLVGFLRGAPEPVRISSRLESFSRNVILRGISGELARFMESTLPFEPGTDSVPLSQEERLLRARQFLVDYRANLSAHEGEMLHDIMLAQKRSGAYLSDDEIFDHVRTLTVAGFGTTRFLLAFALRHVLQDEGRREKVENEARAFDIDPQDPKPLAQRFPVISGVLKEVLQLYPPVRTLLAREARESFVVPGTDFAVEAGASLVIDTAAAQANAGGKLLAFGHGQRACPGQTLALTESIMCLHGLVGNFDMQVTLDTITIREPDFDNLSTPGQSLIKPHGDFLVVFRPWATRTTLKPKPRISDIPPP